MEVIYLIGKKLFAKKVLLKNSLQTNKKNPTESADIPADLLIKTATLLLDGVGEGPQGTCLWSSVKLYHSALAGKR